MDEKAVSIGLARVFSVFACKKVLKNPTVLNLSVIGASCLRSIRWHYIRLICSGVGMRWRETGAVDGMSAIMLTGGFSLIAVSHI